MVDQRYIDYVKTNIGKYPLESVKQGLANANVPPDQIEEAVREATRPQAAPPPPPPPPLAPPAPQPAPQVLKPEQPSQFSQAFVYQKPAESSGEEYSHPESVVRHSYPLNAGQDGLIAAAGLCLKTLPFILLRLGILVGATIVSIIWFIIVLYSGALLARIFGGKPGLIIFLIGWGIPAGFFYWLKKYVLYSLKLAHIAVLTRLITHGSLEGGENQVSYGKNAVLANFSQANMLFVLDSMIDGIVRSFMSSVDWLANFLPIPGISGIMSNVNRIMRNATTYIDETIFSYNLARNDDNKWRSSKDGLIYYAQNWKPVMKTAVYAWILEYLFSFFAFLAFVIPLALVGKFIPNLGGWFLVFAILLALNIKSAVLHPLMLTMVALTFHKAVHNQEISAEMDQTLCSISGKFVELGGKAKNWTKETAGGLKGGAPAPQPG